LVVAEVALGFIAARGRLEVLLEPDDELEFLVSLLPHLAMAKRAMTTAATTTTNATFPPLARFVVVGA